MKRARNESWKQYRSQNKSLIHLTYRNYNTNKTRQEKKKKTRQSSNKTVYEHETRLIKCQEIQGKTNLWNCRPRKPKEMTYLLQLLLVKVMK